MFRVPGAREICLWMGAVDASRKSADYVLQQGLSVIVYPGGSKELFNTDPTSKKNKLVLKERKGFIKLAIRHGADLVPTFVFGEKSMYSMWRPPRRLWKWLLKVLRIPLIVFWGRFGTWMPYRKPLAIVYGKPLEVQQEGNPSDEQVERLHQAFMESINTLFHEYRDRFGYHTEELLEIH